MSKKKYWGDAIGAPEKLGHFQPGQFVVLLNEDFTMRLNEIYQVGVMPASYFPEGSDKQNWGGRVLVNNVGHVIFYHNSSMVRAVNDIGVRQGSREFYSPTIANERKRADEKAKAEAAEAQRKAEQEKKEQAARDRAREGCNEFLRETSYFNAKACTQFIRTEDMQKEIDRIVNMYTSTKYTRITFQRECINSGFFGPVWPSVEPLTGPNIYSVSVKDKSGRVLPEVHSVEILIRNSPSWM